MWLPFSCCAGGWITRINDTTEKAQELTVSRRASRTATSQAPRAGAPLALPSDTQIRTEVPVLGMTCRTCELRITRNVMKIPSVLQASASASRGRVIIDSTRPLSYRALERAIQQAGYEIGE